MSEREQGLDDRGTDAPITANPWADPPARAYEPPIRLAWPPALLVAIIIALYAYQTTLPDPEGFALSLAFTPRSMLDSSGWTGMFTSLFVHGSWTHVLTNAVAALMFGTGVARRLGTGWIGGLLFFVFFLVCGLVGNLGYALVHPNGLNPVIGASGGIAGFYAATSRLLRKGPLTPILSPQVIIMGAVWIVANLVAGLGHIDTGFGPNGAPLAWESHIAGYFAGLFLIGMFDMSVPRRRLVGGQA